MSAALPDDGTGVAAMAALEAAAPTVRDEEWARRCGNGERGVDRTLVGKWASGERGLPLWAVVRMTRWLLPAKRAEVWGHILAPLGLTVVVTPPAEGDRTVSIEQAALGLGAAVGAVQAAVMDATAPRGPGGRTITPIERAALRVAVESAQRALAGVGEMFRPGVA